MGVTKPETPDGCWRPAAPPAAPTLNSPEDVVELDWGDTEPKLPVVNRGGCRPDEVTFEFPDFWMGFWVGLPVAEVVNFDVGMLETEVRGSIEFLFSAVRSTDLALVLRFLW